MTSSFFDFAADGDEEEQAFEKGDDISLDENGMKTWRFSAKRVEFALKKFVTSFPIVPAEEWVHRKRDHRGLPCSGRMCRGHLLKAGTTYICTLSGRIHECPASGCRLGELSKLEDIRRCPLTGNDSDGPRIPDDGYGKGNGEEGQPNDDEEEDRSEPLIPDELSLTDLHEQKEPLRPAKIQRISKEARQSTAADIGILQSEAASVVRSIIPFATQAQKDEWVDNHILYLWNLVIQTKCHRQHSLSYKMAAHTRVVLDAMIEGFDVDGFSVVPPMKAIIDAVKDKRIKIHPALSAKKFFRRCLEETIDSSQAPKELLKIISERK